MDSAFRRLQLPQRARLLMVSDIHGSLSLLRALLKKCEYDPERDFLFLLGDFIEKGKESSADCLRAILQMERELPHVYLTQGNCDNIRWMLDLPDGDFRSLIEDRQRNSILKSWMDEDGLSFAASSIPAVKAALLQRHKSEIDHLLSLPLLIETDELLLSHSGAAADVRASTRHDCVKNDDFFFRSLGYDRWFVFGHMPAQNFHDSCTGNPLLDRRRRLAAIDGGNAIKRFGQLNALIVHKDGGELIFETRFADPSPKARALRDVIGLPESGTCCADFFCRQVERVLSVNAHFTLCRMKNSGRNSYVKNEWLERRDGGLTVRCACSQEFPALRKGQEVYLLEDKLSGYDLIKTEDGRVGWVEKGALGPV